MHTDDVRNGNLAALIAQIEPPTERTATGEPCRCPEHVLDCNCGAYQGQVA